MAQNEITESERGKTTVNMNYLTQIMDEATKERTKAIETLRKRKMFLRFLTDNRTFLENLDANGIALFEQWDGFCIDIHSPSRRAVLECVKYFRCKWSKHLTYDKQTLYYQTEHKVWGRIRLWDTELPNNCRKVKTTLVVPAKEAVPAEPEHKHEVEQIVCELPQEGF